jgi:hypothetical protein
MAEIKTRDEIAQEFIEQGVDPESSNFSDRVEESFQAQNAQGLEDVASQEEEARQGRLRENLGEEGYREYQEQQRYNEAAQELPGAGKTLVTEYMRLKDIAEGRAGPSKAVQDIQAQRQSLQALSTGQAARARDPFAAARQALAQRAGAEVAGSAQRQIASQEQAEQSRANELMRQMRMGAEIRAEQARLAEEQRESLFAGGIGSLLGAGLGAASMAFGVPLPVAAGLISAGGGLGGQIGQMVSDERMKSNVRDGNSDAKAMLDALSAKKYDKFGEEEVGIMAQDLEKSKAGDKMVEEVEGVKTIPKGFGEVLAAMANLNDRLSKLEKK